MKALNKCSESVIIRSGVNGALTPGQTVLPTQAHSTQVTKSELASADGQTVPPSRARSQENHSVNCRLLARAVRPNNNKTTLRELARELAEVAKRWKTWLVELGENLSFIKFKPTRSSSSQVGSKTMPNMDQIENLGKGGLGWENRLSTVIQASHSCRI